MVPLLTFFVAYLAEAPLSTDSAPSLIHRLFLPPLRAVWQPIDAWLAGLPMWVAGLCAMSLFLAAGIWVWTLRRDYIYLGAPDQRPWRDLRIWATVVLIPYMLIYWFLGVR